MTSQVSLLLILQRFQLTRSRGAWPISVFWIAKYRYFNSHAHVERDACSFQQNYCVLNFNSHAHVERDIGFLWGYDRWDHFNSHAHVERDTFPFTIAGETLNFNSHAHVERDCGRLDFFSTPNISTHTLTWSVTSSSFRRSTSSSFQLTRSRGAWRKLRSRQLRKWKFQLTRSRGAWQAQRYTMAAIRYFNSHAHVERDYSRTTLAISQLSFQLTRSRGAWPRLYCSMLCSW